MFRMRMRIARIRALGPEDSARITTTRAAMLSHLAACLQKAKNTGM